MIKKLLFLLIFLHCTQIHSQNELEKRAFKLLNNPTEKDSTLVENKNNIFIDTRDGKTYKIVKIGNQTWFAENLAFKVKGKIWSYQNDTNNIAQYGYLYSWKSAKKACPTGWHIPSKAEVDSLFSHFYDKSKYQWEGTSLYYSLIPGGNSGFSAQFSGWFDNNSYSLIKEWAGYWTSSKDEYGKLIFMNILHKDKVARTFSTDEIEGLSVRCVKNN